MNKHNPCLLMPWGFQVAGWTLLVLTLLFPVFIMLTWKVINYNVIFNKFPYDWIKTMLYLASGLIVFSREKIEDEYISTVRTSSVVTSVYIAGLWFVLFSIFQGFFPAMAERAASFSENTHYLEQTFLQRLVVMIKYWLGVPLFAFWIYIMIYKSRLFIAGRRMHNEK